MKNLFYTSPKYLQNLKGLGSSASEIDGSVSKTNGYVTVAMFGDVDGDATMALSSAITYAQNNNVMLINNGDITISGYVSIDASKPLVLKGGKIITDKGGLSIGSSPVVTTVGNTYSDIGSNSITVLSSVGVEKGMLMVVSSPTDLEETTRKCKRVIVGIVDKIIDTEIFINTPLDIPILAEEYSVNFYRVADIAISCDIEAGSYRANTSEVISACIKAFYTNNFTYSGTLSGKGGYYQGLPDQGDANTQINGIAIYYSVGHRILNPNFKFLHYGMIVGYGTTLGITTEPKANGCRHLCNHNHSATKNIILNGQGYGNYATFDSHEGAIDTRHINCRAYNDEIASKFRGRKDIVSGSFDAISLEQDSGLNSLFPDETSKVGSNLLKYFSGEIMKKSDVRLNSNNIVLDNITTKDAAFGCSSTSNSMNIVFSGFCRMFFDDDIAARVAAIDMPTNGSVYIDVLKIYGQDRDTTPTSIDTTKIIGLYYNKANIPLTINNLVVSGCRAGIYLNKYNEETKLININKLEVNRSGSGIYVINSGVTKVENFSYAKLSSNFQNITNGYSRLVQDIIMYDATTGSAILKSNVNCPAMYAYSI